MAGYQRPLNHTFTTAATGVSGTVNLNATPRNLAIQANFGGGTSGTSVDAYVQTSLDGGDTWRDIANFHFTTTAGIRAFNLSGVTPVTSINTPGDGALSANTAVDGLLGPHFRVKYVSVGTYDAPGATLKIDLASIDIVGVVIPS